MFKYIVRNYYNIVFLTPSFFLKQNKSVKNILKYLIVSHEFSFKAIIITVQSEE